MEQASFGLAHRDFRRRRNALHNLANILLDGPGKTQHLLRALIRSFSQGPHLFRDHREAAALVAGARRLNGCVQRQQVGLIGNPADRERDLADRLGPPGKFLDHFHIGLLAGGILFDRTHGSDDLAGGFAQHQRHIGGAAGRRYLPRYGRR